ncbi:MAG: neutral/alkaline non-lysosomal ceramidase N-terminal domain-containing protein [Pirellulaceae bacterium]|nr:neutral/alkaline non-lysosomal ceramidase N-terminal domain-containing protein [Pirellulaceae bacterium]
MKTIDSITALKHHASTQFHTVSDVRSTGRKKCLLVAFAVLLGVAAEREAGADQLWAGAAKVDITNIEAGPVNDRLYVKALVVKTADTTVALVTVDAVAIAEIGSIRNEYLGNVRARLEKELSIQPANVLINASHCHGTVCTDIEQRTFEAIEQAMGKMVPVTIGTGTGHEDRIMENRRLKLKNGKEIDIRHAYSLPPDEEVAEVGPVDPEIGVLRLDREDGRTLAVVYNFACHPIQGVPSGGNTADMIGFASTVIEENLSDGTIALFLQGCAGDINPIAYKPANRPRDAEPLGNLLGLSTLRAVRKIQSKADDRLVVLNEVIALPRADLAQRIIAMETEQLRLVQSLRGTFLNLQSFMPLAVKYNLSAEFPSAYSYRYLHEEAMGRDDLRKLDTLNRNNMKKYIRNIYIMEQLTRLNTNLALLRKHQANLVAGGKRTIDVELLGIRIGDFVLITFPGELTVRIGLNIKGESPHDLTFVAGYTNGYIYYAPTAEQLRNVGGAQEDSDCLLASAWQSLFENRAAEMLRKL